MGKKTLTLTKFTSPIKTKKKPSKEEKPKSTSFGRTVWCANRSELLLLFVSQAYLSDAEFESVLGMTKEAFNAQPKWKRDMQKKKVDLF